MTYLKMLSLVFSLSIIASSTNYILCMPLEKETSLQKYLGVNGVLGLTKFIDSETEDIDINKVIESIRWENINPIEEDISLGGIASYIYKAIEQFKLSRDKNQEFYPLEIGNAFNWGKMLKDPEFLKQLRTVIDFECLTKIIAAKKDWKFPIKINTENAYKSIKQLDTKKNKEEIKELVDYAANKAENIVARAVNKELGKKICCNGCVYYPAGVLTGAAIAYYLLATAYTLQPV